MGGGSARIGGTKEARVKDKNKVLAVAILHFPTSLAVLAPSTLSLSCSWGRGGRRELSCLNVSVYVPARVCVFVHADIVHLQLYREVERMSILFCLSRLYIYLIQSPPPFSTHTHTNTCAHTLWVVNEIITVFNAVTDKTKNRSITSKLLGYFLLPPVPREKYPSRIASKSSKKNS